MDTNTMNTSTDPAAGAATEATISAGDEDPRPALVEAMVAVAPVVAAAARADHSLPTPCDQLPVGAMLAHLNAVGRRIIAIGEGRPAGSVPDSVAAADDDWSGAWQASTDEVRAAWLGRDHGADAQAPWRTMTVAEAARIYCAEVTVHGWDLATAIGEPLAVPDPVLAAGAAGLRAELPATGRGELFAQLRAQSPEEWRSDDPFGEVVGTGGDATPLERLVALSGRSPRWPAR